MVKWIKRLLGITAAQKIEATISQFTGITDTLRAAIIEIDGDITDNQIEIQALKTENTNLGKSKVEALSLIKGISELLGN